jgi:hypothetical protein
VLTAFLEDRVKEIFAAEGLAAFEMPREAAAFHEAGHCVVGAHEKFRIKRAVIFKAAPSAAATALFGEDVWAGRTSGLKTWTVSPRTAPFEDLKHARMTIAGQAAESVAGVARSASSLDEIIIAQAMVDAAAKKLGVGGEQLWRDVWRQTAAICHQNRRIVGVIADRLLRLGSITGNPLRRLLAEVEQIPRSQL